MPSLIELIEAHKALRLDQRLLYEEDLAGCYIMLGKKEKALNEIEEHFDQPEDGTKLSSSLSTMASTANPGLRH